MGTDNWVGPKVAVGFTYMRSTSSPNHVDHNQKLYSLLEKDIQEFRDEGYVVLMMGDFNGHLGIRSNENPWGIIGDTCVRNKNGSLLLEFLKKSNLSIMNNLDICKGTFTRIEGGNRSIVDYGLFDDSSQHLLKELIIDEGKEMAQGSDHALLKLNIKTSARIGLKKKADIKRFQLGDNTDYSKYKARIDANLSKVMASSN